MLSGNLELLIDAVIDLRQETNRQAKADGLVFEEDEIITKELIETTIKELLGSYRVEGDKRIAVYTAFRLEKKT